VRRYIAYAIGEIALVVIGILIAVMINDWNEARRANNLEQVFLKNLRNEMAANSSMLSTVIHYQEVSRDAALRLLEIYNNDFKNYNTNELDSLLGAVQWAWSFEPQLSVLNSIKSTGQIDIIKDEKVKNFITTFEESTKGSQSISLFLRDFMRDQYVPSVSQFISQRNRMVHIGFAEVQYSKFKSSYEELFNSREVESHLTYVYVWRKDEVVALKYIQSSLIESIELIDKSISKKL
jgi:type II secretory pathway pseudopilin PulG